MNCFNHQSKAAIGICRWCGKGICEECFTETAGGLACSAICEKRLAVISQTITTSDDLIRTANRQVRSTGVYGIVTGILFVGFGIWSYTSGETFLPVFFGAIGLVLFALGFVRLTREKYPTG